MCEPGNTVYLSPGDQVCSVEEDHNGKIELFKVQNDIFSAILPRSWLPEMRGGEKGFYVVVLRTCLSSSGVRTLGSSWNYGQYLIFERVSWID